MMLIRELFSTFYFMKRFSLLLYLFTGSVFSQEVTPSSTLFQRFKEHQSVIDSRLTPEIDSPPMTNDLLLPTPNVGDTGKCFTIEAIRLQAIDTALPPHTDSYLIEVLSKQAISVPHYSDSSFSLSDIGNDSPPCLSLSHIKSIMTHLQNRFIGKGFVTTRILTPDQDLTQGELALTIAVGKIGAFQVKSEQSLQTHSNRATLANAFPSSTGDTLNLRDLEQGLENLRRLPTVSAQMDIEAGDKANNSIVDVSWSQKKYPFRFNISIDDSGSESTGKYLGTVGVAWDNPLHLNDIFNISYTHSLKAGVELDSPTGGSDKSSTHNYATNYSIPWGYWLLDMGMSRYSYDQVVAGVNRNYHYTGDSTQGSLSLSRVLYRDNRHKVSATAGLWGKATQNYIDDAEIDVQRRRAGGWKAGLKQRSYFELGTLNTSLNFKRGTRAFGGLAAPEELFDEGTAKSKIWTADIQWLMPFEIFTQPFSWTSHFHGQLSQTRLTPQDKISIGGRYTVRGFTGNRSLSSEDGWYFRNDVSWQYFSTHQLYLGLDIGRVSGESAETLLGHSLSGAVLGLKGQFNKYGQWNYDVFVGTPISSPDGFDEDSVATGFNLSYSF